MGFEFPKILYGLGFLAIPIIVHLFNFKQQKQIWFSNVWFLKEIKQENKTKNRVKDLIILIIRMLLITCLVLAFAKPYFLTESSKQTIAPNVSFYIDNSNSMSLKNNNLTLLQLSKQVIKNTIDGFSLNTKFNYITNDLNSSYQHLFDKQNFIKQLNLIDYTTVNTSVTSIFKTQNDNLHKQTNNPFSIYILSDFQKSTFLLESLKQFDTLSHVILVPIQSANKFNISIDSAWIENNSLINKHQTMWVSAYNYSNKDVENNTIRMHINNKLYTIKNVALLKNSLTTFSLQSPNLVNESIFGKIEIEDQLATFDNVLYFAKNYIPKLNVIEVRPTKISENLNFEKLFKIDSSFNYTLFNELNIQYQKLSDAQLIILNEIEKLSNGLEFSINQCLEKGGKLLIIPPTNALKSTFNLILNRFQLPYITNIDTNITNVEAIKSNNILLKNVFNEFDKTMLLPKFKAYYRFTNSHQTFGLNHLMFENSQALLLEFQANKNHIFLFTAPLNKQNTNFTEHSLFVPTLYNIAYSHLNSFQLYYINGSNCIINIANLVQHEKSKIHISNLNNTFDFIPYSKSINQSLHIYLNNDITQNGIFNIKKNDSIIQYIAYNASKKESDVSCYSIEELNKKIKQLNLNNVSVLADALKLNKHSLVINSDSLNLWKYLILLALILLILEIIIIRFFR